MSAWSTGVFKTGAILVAQAGARGVSRPAGVRGQVAGEHDGGHSRARAHAAQRGADAGVGGVAMVLWEPLVARGWSVLQDDLVPGGHIVKIRGPFLPHLAAKGSSAEHEGRSSAPPASRSSVPSNSPCRRFCRFRAGRDGTSRNLFGQPALTLHGALVFFRPY